MKHYFVLAVLAALAPLASAQQPARLDPADPGAKAPAVKYESAFTGYAPYREEKLAPWREVNDEVGKVRGHAGIFGGAGHAGQGASEKASPAKPASGKPAAGKPAEPAGQAPARGAPKTGHQGH